MTPITRGLSEPAAASTQTDEQDEREGLPVPTNLASAAVEVLRVALPLMVSTGMMSVVLFADRTFLMFFDGVSMSAAMTGGNLFWVIVCVPIGTAAMTGAVIGQLIGNNEPEKIGRLLWQSFWLSLMTIPWFVAAAAGAETLLHWTGQPVDLIPAEATYMRWLMIGGVGLVIESALSGFFSGTERTSVIMWVSVASGVLNVVLDALLIFGLAGFPRWGIAGAAIGSSIAFWCKAACYAWLLAAAQLERRYAMRRGFCLDAAMMRNFLYFSLPSGLMYLTEAGAFTVIVLKIGQLGDVPLRATTMAINFNMIAFIPLVGIAIAASVLVGRHLLQNGPEFAVRSSIASLVVALVYSSFWAIAYLVAGDWLLSLYAIGTPDANSLMAIELASGLLGFVASYVLVDAVQLILAAALKGAGDTWFVLGAGTTTSLISIGFGIALDPGGESLSWWWWVITIWIWTLAIVMTTRFLNGRWKTMRMV